MGRVGDAWNVLLGRYPRNRDLLERVERVEHEWHQTSLDLADTMEKLHRWTGRMRKRQQREITSNLDSQAQPAPAPSPISPREARRLRRQQAGRARVNRRRSESNSSDVREGGEEGGEEG